jgi:hypothetical protein
MRELTRSALLRESTRGALRAWGIYGGLVAAAEPARPRTRRVTPHPLEQHLLPGMKVRTLRSLARVIVEPKFHQIVTARISVGTEPTALLAAQQELADVLARVDATYPTAPDGIGLTLGWGLPYFRRFVADAAARRLPLDLRLSRREGRPALSLRDARRFPSDPVTTTLENNDVVFYFRTNVPEHIVDVNDRIFGALGGMFEITTIRRGFIGAGLPHARARAARLAVAAKINRYAPLFLGAYPLHPFGEGPGRITNIETLGYAGRLDYFRHGTHMHLSHLFEDLEQFYGADASHRSDLLLGHGFAISRRTGLARPQRGEDGHTYSANSGTIQRSYAATLDNPFFWSAGSADSGVQPAPGLHFVASSATTNEFDRYRFAMDGRDDRGRPLPANLRPERDVASRAFNRMIRASHRQNFIVPPRTHRSFPLAELQPKA